jgi:starch-binding outer membrane protein, SusD/RagB family
MKNLFKYIVLSFSLLSVATACNEDIIETTPQQSVTPEIALANATRAQALVYSIYRRMHEFGYYGQTMNIAGDILADNLVIGNNTGRYVGQTVNAVGAHVDLWGRYPAINECNILLSVIDGLEGTQALKDQLKGEAFFLRALMYHDMSKVYGYEPGREVNGWNRSVVLRTTPTTQVSDADFRSRATNTEMYTQIEQDLLAAIGLLPEESGVAAAQRYYRASKAAARAILARVYLYQGRYADAATMADLALGSTSRTVVSAANFAGSWSTIPHPESIFELEIRQVDWSTVDGVNNGMASVANTGSAPNAQLAVGGSAELIAAHEAGDVRLNIWQPAVGGIYPCRKWAGEKGQFLENIPVMRVSELRLIAAEAKARSGNEPGARTDLNAVRSNRGLADNNDAGQALIDAILAEKRIEMAGEGHRFFDLKRLGLNIPKPASTNQPALAYTDFRVIGILPIAQIQLNPQLEQNPNY